MRKIKIFVSLLVVYEFLMITILQIPRYCDVFFSVGFCSIYFRYFLLCIVIPTLVMLFVWWTPELSRAICKKCQCEEKKEEPIKDNLERLITAALILGVQKFVNNHPQTKKAFDNIVEVLNKATSTKD